MFIYPCFGQWVINRTLRNQNRAVETIEKVESCRNYTFAVRCALPEAPWSSWSQETTVLTQLNGKTIQSKRTIDFNNPDVLFQVSFSSLEGDFKPHLWRELLSSVDNGVRKVLVMWKVGTL